MLVSIADQTGPNSSIPSAQVEIYAYHMSSCPEPTMTAPTLLARPLRLSRPWPWRVADGLAERIAAAAGSARAAWQRLQERRREARELDAAGELNEATLRDMGAPDWLQAEANARREVRRLERELLGFGRRDAGARHY
jgi:hypothetical protein